MVWIIAEECLCFLRLGHVREMKTVLKKIIILK